jgi:hypothetical protein
MLGELLLFTTFWSLHHIDTIFIVLARPTLLIPYFQSCREEYKHSKDGGGAFSQMSMAPHHFAV